MNKHREVLGKVLKMSKERNKAYSELLSVDEEQSLQYALDVIDRCEEDKISKIMYEMTNKGANSKWIAKALKSYILGEERS